MAGTDAKVYIIIYGKHGKTEKIFLEKPINNEFPFEQGKTDKFQFRNLDVGPIKQVRASHLGRQMGVGWFLEDMMISSPMFEEIYHFYVHKWFSQFDDDGKTERTIIPTRVTIKPEVEYSISIKTGDLKNAGTNSTVFMVIYGKYLKTDLLLLKMSSFNSALFEKGSVDIFQKKATDVGKIKKIKIGHDNWKQNSGWFLDQVWIKTPHLKKIFFFEAQVWLDREKEEGINEKILYLTQEIDDHDKNDEKTFNKLEMNQRAKEPVIYRRKPKNHVEKKKNKNKSAPRIIKYIIEIKTGNKMGSGTDASVFLELHGDGIKTEKFFLDKNNSTKQEDKNLFEKNNLDEFIVKGPFIEKINKITLGHDSKNFASGWFIENIKIKTIEKIYFFHLNCWLDEAEEDGKIIKNFSPDKIENNFNVEEFQNYSYVKKNANKRGTFDLDTPSHIQKDNNNDNNNNYNNNNYNNNNNNNKINNNNNNSKVYYVLAVKTGKKFGSGTDSQVYIQLTGENNNKNDDNNEKIILDKKLNDLYFEKFKEKNKNKNIFERGKTDFFLLLSPYIGKLKTLTIGHDGTKFGSGWFLDFVEIQVFNLNLEKIFFLKQKNKEEKEENNEDGKEEKYYFKAGRWLDKKEGDGLTEIKLFAS